MYEQGKKWRKWLKPVAAMAAACVLHELYDWTGGSVWAGIFAAANESIWEHAKIISLSYLLIAFAEWLPTRKPAKRFWVSKTVGLWGIVCTTAAVYGLGKSLLYLPAAVHLLFTAAVLVGAFVLENAVARCKCEKWWIPALLALLLYAVCYLSLTVNAPQNALFKDPITGAYGLPTVQGVSTIPV